MYYLNPTPEWTAFRRSGQPQQKRDANNNPMFERFPRQGQPPRPLLDFPILPDTVSVHRPICFESRFNTCHRSAAERSSGG